mmetsp:Transcript_30547/g.31084  ORF Transcript_30547/g.31084 Transcript_30547/m.31084 type:complete len:298 (+) Transcript_30547:60-953(+)
MSFSKATQSLPPEFVESVKKFYSILLDCRPNDTIDFAARFFEEETLPNSEILHAIHSLQYLLNATKQFRDAASIIYSFETSQNNMNGATVLRILRQMKTKDSKYYLDIIDQLTKEFLPVNETVGFEQFIAIIQLPILCSGLVSWMRTMIVSCSTKGSFESLLEEEDEVSDTVNVFILLDEMRSTTPSLANKPIPRSSLLSGPNNRNGPQNLNNGSNNGNMGLLTGLIGSEKLIPGVQIGSDSDRELLWSVLVSFIERCGAGRAENLRIHLSEMTMEFLKKHFSQNIHFTPTILGVST